LDSLNLAWDRNRKTALGSDVWTIRAFVKADFVIQRQKTELKTLIKQLSESERKVE
jgi:hypothetical protein